MDFKQKYISDADKQSPDQVFLNQLAEKMKETAENGNFEESIPTRIIKYKNNKIPSVIAACAVFMLCTAAGLYFSTHRKNDINLITTEISSTTSVTAAVQTTSEQKQHFSETTVLSEIILPAETSSPSETIAPLKTTSPPETELSSNPVFSETTENTYAVTQNTKETTTHITYTKPPVTYTEPPVKSEKPTIQVTSAHKTSSVTESVSEDITEITTSTVTEDITTTSEFVTTTPPVTTPPENTTVTLKYDRYGAPYLSSNSKILTLEYNENYEKVYYYQEFYGLHRSSGLLQVVEQEPDEEEIYAMLGETYKLQTNITDSCRYLINCSEPYAVRYTIMSVGGLDRYSMIRYEIDYAPDYFVDKIATCIYDYKTGEKIADTAFYHFTY